MKLPSRFIAVVLAGLALPAPAADQAATASPSLADLGHAFKNALTEEETRLLIEYMRDSVLAAFNDEEVTLPPDLAFKLEVLSQRLKKESNFYLDIWLKQLEADIRRSLMEKMEVPPPVPYTPPEVPLLVPAINVPVAPPAAPRGVAAPAAVPQKANNVPNTTYLPTPWGYVPWFYVPQPNYSAPPYTPPTPPRFIPPEPAAANKPN
jgi:hypothetical protein